MPLSSALERRVEAILRDMTLAEKASLLSGKDTMTTMPLPRFSLPSLAMSDGPHGLTSAPATCFPSGVSLAATWNPDLINQVGAALAEEALAKGKDILLGPCVNIVRHPLGGRNFESFGEDPFLSGQIGIAYVNGVHSRDVGTSLKHFACNNQETERLRASSEVDERTLRELYLPHFEAIVTQARPWTIMCSYNRLNSIYASENRHLLIDILKNEWGFEGVVVSDWGANHTIVESVLNGLDLEMPGPARYYGKNLIDAVISLQIPETAVDAAARRMIRLCLRSGRKYEAKKRPAGSQNTRAHQLLARKAAEEAITLLKNDRAVLPLDLKKIRSLAVIGPAATLIPRGGGSSWCTPPYAISPLDGIRARLGDHVRIEYRKGCENDPNVPAAIASLFRTVDGKKHGLTASYFSNSGLSGKPVSVESGKVPDIRVHFGQAPAEGVDKVNYSIRWQGTLKAPETGCFRMRAGCWGNCRVVFDGREIVNTRNKRLPGRAWFDAHWFEDVILTRGHAYRITIEYSKTQNEDVGWMRLGFGLSPDAGQQSAIDKAVEAAKSCDAVIVCAGFPDAFEGEAQDRQNMELPGRQNELIAAVASANQSTVVVVTAGSPVTMPWIDQVAAVLFAYYPGLEGGSALARLLAGDVCPSGKLPVTLPRRLEDTPAFVNFPGTIDKVIYGEGIFVGYRWYDKREIAPLFPFGHGLSYTSFAYGNLRVQGSMKPGRTIRVSLNVKNTGARDGAETVQLYISDPESGHPRPPRELKGFRKIFLRCGQSATVAFELDERAFSYWHPERNCWVMEPGEFVIEAGSSSRDIRMRRMAAHTVVEKGI